MYMKIKNFFEPIAALILLIILFPILILVVLLIYFLMGKPIIFKQQRTGLDGKPFIFYKFRTMKNISNYEKENITDKERITSLGSFLRESSIDELPSLFNIIKGQMSFVGPRPLLIEYLNLYSDKQMNRHNVKPGITGLAQINGRNLVNWQKKFDYDLEYISNQSLLLDLKIIFYTIFKVLKREGINNSEDNIMEKFKGNEKK